MLISYSVDPMMVEFGYEPKTTFWNDFTIADKFGLEAIKDTYHRAFRDWKSNYVYLTELVMVLNHKIWEWHEKKNEAYSKLYNSLWEEVDGWACENLSGEQADYFFSVLD